MKRPGFPEAVWFESGDHIEGFEGRIVVRFGLGGRDVADRAEEAMVVEPIHPAQCRHFHCGYTWPGALAPNNFGLVETVDRLGQGVVIRIAHAADRGDEIGFCKALCVVHGEILNAPVAVMDQAIIRAGPASMDSLLQGIEDKAGRRRRTDLPAHDPARIGIDHEGDIDEACPSVDVGKIDHPQGIGPRDAELPIDLVQGTRRLGIADGGHRLLAPPYTGKPMLRMRRSTVHLATEMPSRRSWCQTLREP